MKKEDIKKFVKDHKTEIIVGAVSVAIAVGAVFALHNNKSSADLEPLKIPDEMPNPAHDHIDEDIFTDLAPQIEDAVLTEGLDEDYIEKTYYVEWPKGGGKEGTYEEVKKVIVHIVDITEP